METLRHPLDKGGRMLNWLRKKKKKAGQAPWPVVYDKIYPPFYNIYTKLDGTEPKLYNEKGQPVHVFFIRDKTSAHASSQLGHHILWDKYNFELKTHFYTHECMLETMGSPIRRYGAFFETRGIRPDSFRIFEENPGLEKDFDLIFTYDDETLNKYANARFVPFCATVKLDFAKIAELDHTYKLLDDNLYQKKNKNISILSSDKTMCELHTLRIETAKYLKRNHLADTYGTFDGGGFVKAYETLKDYRYSFVFENIISDYTFTEKLTNCFAMQTIPVYIGAAKINQFFNTDGIIQISLNDLTNLEKIVKECTAENYKERQQAVLDNYQRVKQFFNVEDWMYETYLQSQFEK